MHVYYKLEYMINTCHEWNVTQLGNMTESLMSGQQRVSTCIEKLTVEILARAWQHSLLYINLALSLVNLPRARTHKMCAMLGRFKRSKSRAQLLPRDSDGCLTLSWSRRDTALLFNWVVIGRRDFFLLFPLCLFPYSRLSSVLLYLYLILFLLFPSVSVWVNTLAWVPHFI